MDRHWRTRHRLGRVLVELGYVTADAVLEALSAQLGLPSTRVDSYTVNPEAVSMLPEKVARQHLAVPLLKVGSTLVVAIATPKNLHAIDDLRFASGCGIQTMVALETEILDALDRYYGNQWVPNDQDESSVVVIDLPGPQLDLHDEVAERSAVTLVERIIARASAERASDIHLEPMKTSLRVRFRIDGTFHEVAHLLLALAPAVLARVKVLSGMDIADHRLPQDGRFSATVSGRGLDIRTSTYPTIWGEKAVLRLLDRSNLKLQLDGVDLSGQLLTSFRDLIRRPEGIILVTGPTGSGKTSTLYAALAELAETGHNITTIEDPVEYWLQGVNQGQTNHKAGFTFARGLRAILRQDPDVIMVRRRFANPENAGDGDRSLADRPHRALDAAYHQRGRHRDPALGDGPRAVSAGVSRERHLGAAARAPHLHHVSEAGAHAGAASEPLLGRRTRATLPRGGVSGLPRDRVPGPVGRARAARDDRTSSGV